MSNPRFNPFAPGKQISPQGPYRGAGGQMQRDPRRQPSLLGSGPSFASPSVNRGPLGGPIPSLLSLPMNFRPEKKETAAEEDAGRRLDCHTGRAREEAVPNFASQNSQFTNVQRNTYPSSNRGRPSFLTAPATQEKRPFTVDSGSSSPDWTSAGESSNMYSSASSGFRSSAIQATGGLRDYETSLSDKTGPPTEAFNPKYTSESATNILLHFGLQREDLEHLTAYPEDQLTPENLPFILRQIRLEKAERTQTAAQSKPYNEPQPTRRVDELGKLKTSRGPVLDPGEIASQVLKTSKVIDYGHTSQSELSSFEPLDEDTDLRQLEPEAPKSVPLKKPAPAPQALSKANLIRGVHPGRPGLVLIGSNTASGANNQRTAGEAASKGPKKKKTQPQQKQQLQMQQQQLQVQQQIQVQQQLHVQQQLQAQQQLQVQQQLQAQQQLQVQQQLQAQQQLQRQRQLQMQQQQQQLQLGQQPTLPQGFPATQLTPSLLIPNCPTPAMRGPNQRDARTGVGVSKQEPTPAMMQDYTAATPRIFPHTCCLCRKECSNLKDWVSHQNTALHLENCQLLRTRYPGWDGWTLDFLSSPGEGTQPAPSTLGKNVQNRHQKSSRETASRSLSPHRQRGSEDRKRGSEDRKERQDRREKRFSPYRSRSPHSYDASESRRERERSRSWSPETSRHSFRSRSRSYDRTTSSYRRSRSGSYEKRRQRREREAAAKRSQESKKMAQKRSSPRRSRERRWSPDRSEPRRRRSRSADRLAKRLLEKAAPPVMSRTKQAELEAVVKSLAPVLLAELANLKSSTAASSSSSSKTEKKSSFSKSTNATLSRQKGGTSSSAKATVSRATSSFHVSVSGVNRSLTYDDIFKAMGTFGKVKSVILYRSTKQARVEFEKEEDAKKLQSLEICQVNGWPVVVDGPMGTASKNPVSTKEQKAAPQKTSAKSDITKGKKQPEPKNTTAGKLVTKAKVLVSKAKGVTVNQATKTVKKATATGNSAGKSVAVKSGASGKKPQADQAKKPVTKTKPAGDNAKSAEAPKQASKITKQSKTTSSTTKPQPTIKADQVSVKASSEVQPSTESKSESSAEAQETINHAVEQQNQSTNKTEAQEDSVQMETETSSVNVKNEPSPRETGTSADKENSPAGSTASSARDPGTTAADLVQMDENVFKELTAAIQMHRLAKGVSSESKGEESTTDSRTTCKDGKQENTQPSKDKKEGKVSLERFDELDFSSGDFVTVDEVNEDMDVPGVEGHPSSSKLTPRDKKGMQSSAARKSSTGSASSSPKSAKGSQSLRSTPVSANKKKSLSEPKKSEAKGHKTCSTGQKAQSNKSEPSSSGQGSHSSETSIKLSVKDQQEKKEIEQAKSDHKAPVESSAANSVEAELNSDSSAKMDVPTEGQSLQETDLKDETVEETKSKENEKKSDTDGKSTGEERGDENKQLLDSLSRKSDEQQNKEDAQDETTVTQTPEVEQDQILHQGGVQVVESTDNNKAQSDECDEMEVSGKLQDGTKDQAAAADDGDEGPSKMEKDNSSEKQEMSVKKDEARTKEIKKGGKSLGDCLVVVYDVLDATKDDLVPKTSAAEGSGRRRSARGNKKQTPAPVEEPKSGNEEETLTALDSVEDESRSDKPVVTRSTRGRRENATKKVEENTKKREDKTPTRRQRTPARDSKEKDGEKTPKADVLSDTVETDTSKETDGVQDDQPITQEPRRGRPKKDNKTSKKQTEPKGESVRQSVDSLKDECQERESETTDEMAADVNNVNTLDQTPQAAFGKASPKTNDETAAATIDDLMNQGELSPEELKKRQAAEKTENEQEEGRSMERETGEQRSQSGADGGGSGEMVRDEEQNREDVETVKEAASESEILNEIGAKAESEAATQEGMITEEGPQELVAEKEEDQKEEQGALEAQSQVQESQPESLSELDEGGQNQSKKTDEEDAMQASSSSKRKHNDNTDVDERKPEPSGPEAKRSRSQSPSVAGDLQLPPFNPQNPLGEEFVVPKSGFFCNLCSVFYLNESTAKKVHCGTRKHYDNLLKHYKKLQQETGGAAQSVQDSL